MRPGNSGLLVPLLDELADDDPNRLFAVAPCGHDPTEGFWHISMGDLARALNYISQWMELTLDDRKSHEVLAYMGGNDVRYCVFALACQKNGYQPFLPSPRISIPEHLHLLREVGCDKLFYSDTQKNRAFEIKEHHHHLQTFQVPSLERIFKSNSTYQDKFPEKAYAEAENDAACIIHTSGTTGMPKPIYLSHGYFATIAHYDELDRPRNRQPSMFWNLQKPVYITTPFYHIMGFISFPFSILHGTPVVYGPDKPPSVDLLIAVLEVARPAAAAFPPSLVEEMCHSERALNCLKHLQAVYVGGAPLASKSGETIQQYTLLISMIGSSEVGVLPAMVPEERADWEYYEWIPNAGVVMENVGGGLYELVIQRNEQPWKTQAIFHTFPEVDSYWTKDLYTRHPRLPHLWKFHCRRDDVIVLSNGEKLSPITMENVIQSHPLVADALVVGQSGFQVGLLVEPHSDALQVNHDQLVDTISPSIEEANRSVAAYGKIMKNMVRIALPSKPFKRTPKGTIQRRSVVQDYANEIEEMYSPGRYNETLIAVPDRLDRSSVSNYLRRVLFKILNKPDIPDTLDLYAAGLDSLMTRQVSGAIEKAIRNRRADLPSRLINQQTLYDHPTVEQLSRFLVDALQGAVCTNATREQNIESFVDRYTSNLPPPDKSAHERGSSLPEAIMLTGSTGGFGTYLLDSLLSKPWVRRIYCMNRSVDAKTKQRTSLLKKRLSTDSDSDRWHNRVVFLQVSTQEPDLGLPQSIYQELLESVDAILHNAWKVDFNQSLASFEANIKGVRHLVDFALDSKHKAPIHFVSSVSTVGNWPVHSDKFVPEDALTDSSVSLSQGYAQSKFVAERICQEASRQSGLSTTIYRVGQIAGPTTSAGIWKKDEWVPAMVKTSLSQGEVPNSLGSIPVDWIPVDTLASIMTELISYSHVDKSDNSCEVFNLANPYPAQWSSLVQPIIDNYAVKPVDLESWVSNLNEIGVPTKSDVSEKPALKLGAFFDQLLSWSSSRPPMLDVSKAKDSSATMKDLSPITPSLMQNWLYQWCF